MADLSELFTPMTAIVFLVFTLLYTPCVAAIATVRREVGSWNALTTVVTQCLSAWVTAWFVHLLGLLAGFS